MLFRSWHLKAAYTHRQSDTDGKVYYGGAGFPNPDGSGPFSLAGREHELVIGASASSAHWKGKDYGNPTFLSANVVDFWNFDGKTTEPDWGAPTQYNDTTTRQTAGYISARFNLTDDLNLLLGTRLANYWLTGDYHTTETGRLVPYVGVTYDLNDNFTADTHLQIGRAHV